MRVPGVCISCREPLIWNGRRWRAPGAWEAHVCAAVARQPGQRWSVVRCGRLMPTARERCVRQPEHAGYCRSPYATDNARLARMA
jgi:hypothetical protein